MLDSSSPFSYHFKMSPVVEPYGPKKMTSYRFPHCTRVYGDIRGNGFEKKNIMNHSSTNQAISICYSETLDSYKLKNLRRSASSVLQT